jgi:hypothetical protein
VYNGLDYTLEEEGFPKEQPLDWDNISRDLTTDNFDVFIWGGFWGEHISAYLSQMNVDAITAIRKFVREGGGYIGICYGGFEISTGSFFPFNWLKGFFPRYPSLLFPGFTTRLTPKALPCKAILTIQLTSENNPLAYGLPSSIEGCGYAAGPMFIGPQGNTETVGIIQDIQEINEGFTAALSDFPLIGGIYNSRINYAKGKPIWVTVDFGKGKVVAFGDHPNIYDYPRIAFNAILYTTSEDLSTLTSDTFVPLSTELLAETEAFKGYVDEPLQFQLSNVSGRIPIHCIWEFDERLQSVEDSPSYIYHRTDNYTVRLTFLDEKGTIFLGSVPVDIREKLDMYLSHGYTRRGDGDTKATFRVGTHGGFPPYLYKWDFGDGTESLQTNQTVYHTYTQPGNYRFEVILSDQLGTEVSDSGFINIDDTNSNHNGLQYVFIVLIVLFLLVVVLAIIYFRKRT